MKNEEKKGAAKEPAKKQLVLKTYCVKGLMEWSLELPTNLPGDVPQKKYITVRFQGGQITGYGVSPARFSTPDPLTQRLIEATPQFKSGKIYIGETEVL